jgi:hypothetical protein
VSASVTKLAKKAMYERLTIMVSVTQVVGGVGGDGVTCRLRLTSFINQIQNLILYSTLRYHEQCRKVMVTAYSASNSIRMTWVEYSPTMTAEWWLARLLAKKNGCSLLNHSCHG